MPKEATQAPEAAGVSDTTQVEQSADSSQEVTTSTDANNAATIEGSNLDDLLRALDQTPSIVAAKPKPSETKTEEVTGGQAAPETETAPVETGTTEEEDDDEDDDERPAQAGEQPVEKPPRNFRLHTEDPKLASFLKTLKSAQKANPNVNPAEVAALIGYKMPGAPAAAPAQVAASEPAVDPLKGLRDEIAQLDVDIEKAEDLEYDSKKARLLERQRNEKVRALEKSEDAMAAQAEADAEFDAGFTAARDQVSKLAPEVDTEGTIQYDLIVAETARVKRNTPDLLDEPGYPLTILNRVAAKHPTLFPKVVQKAPVSAPAALATAKAPAGKPTSRPVGTVVPGNNAGPVVDSSNAKATLDTLSPEQLIKLANQLPPDVPKRK